MATALCRGGPDRLLYEMGPQRLHGGGITGKLLAARYVSSSQQSLLSIVCGCRVWEQLHAVFRHLFEEVAREQQ